LDSDAAAEQDVDTAQAALAALAKLFTQHRALTDMLVDDAGADSVPLPGIDMTSALDSMPEPRSDSCTPCPSRLMCMSRVMWLAVTADCGQL